MAVQPKETFRTSRVALNFCFTMGAFCKFLLKMFEEITKVIVGFDRVEIGSVKGIYLTTVPIRAEVDPSNSTSISNSWPIMGRVGPSKKWPDFEACYH